MDMKQCLLKKGQNGIVAWIPVQYAVVGKAIKIKNNRQWDDGWKVSEVWSPAFSEEQIAENFKDHRTHREATDI